MKMKDYSNYHDIDVKAKIEHDGNLIFESSLNGVSGRDILINDVSTRGIITSKFNSDDGQIKYIMGRNEELFRGSVVDYENMKWLVTSIPHFNGVYKKAEITICNNTITLLTQECTVVGQNDFGEDIVVCNPSEIIDLPCIVERSTVASNTERAINLPEGKANVTIPFTVNDSIKIGQSIDLYAEKYEIQDIDYTKSLGETGLMILNVEKKVGES
jgi:hypothetical protein